MNDLEAEIAKLKKEVLRTQYEYKRKSSELIIENFDWLASIVNPFTQEYNGLGFDVCNCASIKSFIIKANNDTVWTDWRTTIDIAMDDTSEFCLAASGCWNIVEYPSVETYKNQEYKNRLELALKDTLISPLCELEKLAQIFDGCISVLWDAEQGSRLVRSDVNPRRLFHPDTN